MAVRITKDDVGKLIASVQGLTAQQVLVGIPSTKAGRKEGPITNAAIGYIHENGAPEINLPARPFLVPGVRESQDKWLPYLKAAALAAIDRKGIEAVDAKLHSVGLIAQNAVKLRIRSGPFAPLSPATLRQRLAKLQAKRGIDKISGKRWRDVTLNDVTIRILIDTAQLLNAVTYVIRKVR